MMGDGVEAQLHTFPASEVQYQSAYSKASLRKVTKANAASAHKDVERMHRRVVKHLTKKKPH